MTLSAFSLALFTFLLGAILDIGIKIGLEVEEALDLTAARIEGVAGLVIKEEETSKVIRKITTKGGLIEKGLKILEDKNIKSLLKHVVKSYIIVAN